MSPSRSRWHASRTEGGARSVMRTGKRVPASTARRRSSAAQSRSRNEVTSDARTGALYAASRLTLPAGVPRAAARFVRNDDHVGAVERLHHGLAQHRMCHPPRPHRIVPRPGSRSSTSVVYLSERSLEARRCGREPRSDPAGSVPAHDHRGVAARRVGYAPRTSGRRVPIPSGCNLPSRQPAHSVGSRRDLQGTAAATTGRRREFVMERPTF